METDKFGNFFSRVSISRNDGSSGISRFMNFGQNVETTSFRNLRGQHYKPAAHVHGLILAQGDEIKNGI